MADGNDEGHLPQDDGRCSCVDKKETQAQIWWSDEGMKAYRAARREVWLANGRSLWKSW